VTGLLGAGALLLIVSGAAKLLHPASAVRAVVAARLTSRSHLPAACALVRLTGIVEVGTGAAVLAIGGRYASAALALVFVALALFAARLSLVAPAEDCGCFGASRAAPVTRWHVGTCAAFAGLAAVASLGSPKSLLAELATSPLGGAPLLATVALLAAACYLLMTALPALLHLAREQVPG